MTLQAFPEALSGQCLPLQGIPDFHRSAGTVCSAPVGVDVDELAAAIARRLGAVGLAPALDTRTLAEALSQVEAVFLARESALSRSSRRNTVLAFRRVLSAPLVELVGAPVGRAVRGVDAAAECNPRGRTFGRGRVQWRCEAGPAYEIDTPEGDVSIAQPLAEVLGSVRICDLGPRHVTIAWNALAGPSLSTYAASFVARLGDAEDLGFVGLKRWRETWPTVPQSRRRHVDVSDEIHRAALLALTWALDDTECSEQTLRLIALALHAPGRLDELCSLRRHMVDLRGMVLRLEDSKTGAGNVVLTTPAADILRAQLASLPWDATHVWPSESAAGHVLRDSVSHAWLRIRRAYAEATQTPEAAALLRWRAHDFRGALATQALEHGASLRHVQDALRHADARTTGRYVHGTSMRGARRAMEIAVGPLRAWAPKKRGES